MDHLPPLKNHLMLILKGLIFVYFFGPFLESFYLKVNIVFHLQMFSTGFAWTSGPGACPPTPHRPATPARAAKNASFHPTSWCRRWPTPCGRSCRTSTGLGQGSVSRCSKRGPNGSRTSTTFPAGRGRRLRASRCPWPARWWLTAELGRPPRRKPSYRWLIARIWDSYLGSLCDESRGPHVNSRWQDWSRKIACCILPITKTQFLTNTSQFSSSVDI